MEEIIIPIPMQRVVEDGSTRFIIPIKNLLTALIDDIKEREGDFDRCEIRLDTAGEEEFVCEILPIRIPENQ